ncbi:MAG: STAS domain-containing protein [Armatimonadetes bacterium]|nr:STAS domain-containing protein [Armatimonadota bacterium]
MSGAAERPWLSCQVEILAPGRALVCPCGEIDIASLSILESALSEAFAAGAEQVIVDLRQVGFLDSEGVKCLLGTWSRLGTRPPRLVVVAPTSCFAYRVLRLLGLTDVVPVVETPEEALAILRVAQ